MNFARFAIAAGAAVALATPALAVPPMRSVPMRGSGPMMSRQIMQTRTFSMRQENGSGQNGSVLVKDTRAGLWVRISVQNEPRYASEPAHIHGGSCAHLNPAPWRVLNNVVSGSSVTTVSGVTVAQVTRGRYAINAHQSLRNLKHYVSCANL